MNNNELKHFGVIGMKWGVRKDREAHYKKRSDISANKAKKAKSQLMRNWHQGRSADFKEMATTSKMMKGQKGIKRLRTQFGFGRTSRILNAKSEKQAFRAKTAKTRIGSDSNQQRSKNFKEMAKVYSKSHDKKGALNKLATAVVGTYWDRPYHKLSGRVTHAGKEHVKIMTAALTAPIGQAVYVVGGVTKYALEREKYGSDAREKKKRN